MKTRQKRRRRQPWLTVSHKISRRMSDSSRCRWRTRPSRLLNNKIYKIVLPQTQMQAATMIKKRSRRILRILRTKRPLLLPSSPARPAAKHSPTKPRRDPALQRTSQHRVSIQKIIKGMQSLCLHASRPLLTSTCSNPRKEAKKS